MVLRQFRKLRFGPRGRSLLCGLTLLTYATATIGLPTGNGIGGRSAGCRCGDDPQSPGECSCMKKLAGSAGTQGERSCCGAAPRRSCCSSRTSNSRQPSRAQAACSCCRRPGGTDAGSPDHPIVSAVCPCGGTRIAGVVCNADPRLLRDNTRVPRQDDDWEFKWGPAALILPDRSIAPETPPPKTPLA